MPVHSTGTATTEVPLLFVFVNYCTPFVRVKGSCRSWWTTPVTKSCVEFSHSFCLFWRRKWSHINFARRNSSFFKLLCSFTHHRQPTPFSINLVAQHRSSVNLSISSLFLGWWRKQWHIIILFVNNCRLILSASTLFISVWCDICSRVGHLLGRWE